MNKQVIRAKGILAAVILIVLAGGVAFGRTPEPKSGGVEVNVAGLTVVGNEWLDSIVLGRVGLGFFSKGVGFELGTVGAPWYGTDGVIFDGALVLNPLYDKPLSPVIRLGAMTSTSGGFLPILCGGIRARLAPAFGLRFEYEQPIPFFGLGMVVGGAYFRF